MKKFSCQSQSLLRSKPAQQAGICCQGFYYVVINMANGGITAYLGLSESCTCRGGGRIIPPLSVGKYELPRSVTRPSCRPLKRLKLPLRDGGINRRPAYIRHRKDIDQLSVGTSAFWSGKRYNHGSIRLWIWAAANATAGCKVTASPACMPFASLHQSCPDVISHTILGTVTFLSGYDLCACAHLTSLARVSRSSITGPGAPTPACHVTATPLVLSRDHVTERAASASVGPA